MTEEKCSRHCPFGNGGEDAYKEGLLWKDRVDHFMKKVNEDMLVSRSEFEKLNNSVNDLKGSMKFYAGIIAAVGSILGILSFAMQFIHFGGGPQ